MPKVLRYVHIDLNNKTVKLRNHYLVFLKSLGKMRSQFLKLFLNLWEMIGWIWIIAAVSVVIMLLQRQTIYQVYKSWLLTKKIQNLHSLTVIITALTCVVSMHLMNSLNLQPFLHILSVTRHFSRTYFYQWATTLKRSRNVI